MGKHITPKTAEEFVRLWQASVTMEEVVEKTGMTNKMASNKARELRLRGVPLKKLKRKGKIDYDALADLARRIEGDKHR